MIVKFGVATNDLEEAQMWVAAAIGLPAEPRESSDWGGDYYGYSGADGEELRLISNRDIYDDGPIVGGCDEWKIVLTAEIESSASIVLKKLESNGIRFVKLAAR